MQYKILIIFFFYIGFSSCKKDKDKSPPIVTLHAPSNELTLKYDDAVEIQASITDDNIIKSVELSLINEQTNIRVLNTITHYPNTNNFNLNEIYIISDSLVPAGRYYFRIEAKDEDNSFSAFRYVNIEGFPRRKLSCIVSCSGWGSTTVYEDRNDFNFEPITTYSSNYLSSELNSFDQQYWFIPQNDNKVSVLDLREYNSPFTQTFTSNINDLFSASNHVNRTTYLSLKSGELQAYNYQFQDIYTYLSPENKRLGQFAIGENFILQEEVFPNGKNREVVVLFRTNGNIKRTFPIADAVTDIFFIEKEKAVLFQNNENGGIIHELSIESTNGLKEMGSLTDSILSVEQISLNEYLLSTPTKIIRYSHNSSSSTTYLNLSRAVIAYDDLNDQLYIASGNTLSLYRNRQTNAISSTTLTGQIKGIDIRYNY